MIAKWNIALLFNNEAIKNGLFHPIPQIVIDSRKIQPKDLFICFDGKRNRASDFALDAINAGAALCVMQNIPKNIINEINSGNEEIKKKIALTTNPQAVLEEIAIFIRQNFIKGKIIGITGSSGKTTLKNMLFHILQYGKNKDLSILKNFEYIFANLGNQNNHLGVALNICRLGVKSQRENFIIQTTATTIAERDSLHSQSHNNNNSNNNSHDNNRNNTNTRPHNTYHHPSYHTIQNYYKNTLALIEMGMNHSGEISHLSSIAKPDIAVITNIGTAHSQFFKNSEEIAAAKSEIFDHMQKNAPAIINSNNPHYHFLLQKAKKKNLKVFTFGEKSSDDVQLIHWEIVENLNINTKDSDNGGEDENNLPFYIKVDVKIQGKDCQYQLTVLGQHIIYNTMAAITTIIALWDMLNMKNQSSSSSIQNIIQELLLPLKFFREPEGRGNIIKYPNSITLFNDCYNANPESMLSSIDKVLLYYKSINKIQLQKKSECNIITDNDKNRERRLVLILGDMMELGNKGPSLHRKIAKHISFISATMKNNNNNKLIVFTVGTFTKKYIYDRLPKEILGQNFLSSEEARHCIPYFLLKNDIVLVKGSSNVNMKQIVQSIKDIKNI